MCCLTTRNQSKSVRSSHQCVGVHEDTFWVMYERPAVEFGEGDPQVRPLHHRQVSCVTTVQHIHQPHLVIDPLQHQPNGSHYLEWIAGIVYLQTRLQRNGTGCDSEVLCHCWEVKVSYWQGSDTWGPMRATSFLDVLCLRRDLPKTMAPLA